MKKIQPAVETIVCDGCGCERSWFSAGTVVRITGIRRCGPMKENLPISRDIDLCDDCSRKLDEFFKLEW